MNKDLTSYVRVLENWIEPSVCLQTINELQSADWRQHTFYNSKNNTQAAKSGSLELDVAYSSILSTKSHIMQRLWDAFYDYITYLNFPWFSSWQGFTEVRFNKYQETRLMAEHCDHIHSMFEGERKGIPILSAVGVLNNNFKGGNFVMWEDTPIAMPGGSITIFPSCFLFPHRVEPVTEGTRYSFVSWAW